jgi:hypothetical protein
MLVVAGGGRGGGGGGGPGGHETVRGATRFLVEGDPAWGGGTVVHSAPHFLGEGVGTARKATHLPPRGGTVREASRFPQGSVDGERASWLHICERGRGEFLLVGLLEPLVLH